MTVRGEAIEATEEFYQCPTCGENFTSRLGHDALDEAYREYRRRHGFLQPEEIRHWRESYGLAQTELSHLLEWDEATLNRKGPYKKSLKISGLSYSYGESPCQRKLSILESNCVTGAFFFPL